MKGFFKSLAREQPGQIGPSLSLHTLQAYLTRFVAAYRRQHGLQIPKIVVEEVRDVSMTKFRLLDVARAYKEY